MASRAAVPFLTRMRVLPPEYLRMPQLTRNALHSHFRPVRHHPDLLGADVIACKVLTQTEERRVPYIPVTRVEACDSISTCSC